MTYFSTCLCMSCATSLTSSPTTVYVECVVQQIQPTLGESNTSFHHLRYHNLCASHFSSLSSGMVLSRESANADNLVCTVNMQLITLNITVQTSQLASRQARYCCMKSISIGIMPSIRDDPLIIQLKIVAYVLYQCT